MKNFIITVLKMTSDLWLSEKNKNKRMIGVAVWWCDDDQLMMWISSNG